METGIIPGLMSHLARTQTKKIISSTRLFNAPDHNVYDSNYVGGTPINIKINHFNGKQV